MAGGDVRLRTRKANFSSSSSKNNEPCVDFLGQGSAGNYVKMIHNGIEYALMEIIAESYHIM